MTEQPPLCAPQLSDLQIRGFRGIGELTVPRLAPVTLIAGRNGVGKTTVLDAVRLHAARGHQFALAQLIERREVQAGRLPGPEAATAPLDFGTLFHRSDRGDKTPILVGPVGDGGVLRIEEKPRERGFSSSEVAELASSSASQVLEVSFLGGVCSLHTAEFNAGWIKNPTLPRSLRSFDDRPDFPPAAKCESIGPESLTAGDAARLWDNIALTEQEDLAVSALNLVLGNEVKRVAMLGGGPADRHVRRIAVRVKGHGSPVSLQSLGDGAVRLFGIAMFMANAGDGFLLIDEVENGIHHSVQSAMWEMVLRTAHRDGVQVLATTHSWDCVRGFAKAAGTTGLDAALVRLEGGNDGFVRWSTVRRIWPSPPSRASRSDSARWPCRRAPCPTVFCLSREGMTSMSWITYVGVTPPSPPSRSGERGAWTNSWRRSVRNSGLLVVALSEWWLTRTTTSRPGGRR